MNTLSTKRKGSRGIALVTTLLLLSLFTVMTLGMVIATTSDTLIDGYYNNFRGSFYASDSGLNAARQYIQNQFASNISPTWSPAGGLPPISTGTEGTIKSALLNASTGFGAYNSITGTQTASWPGKFQIDSNTANTFINAGTCLPAYTGTAAPLPTCTATGSTLDTITAYNYTYLYQITVLGQARNNEQNKVVENGSIIVNVPVQINTTTAQSFAAWGMFIDQSPICNGSYLVPGTISGPVFTNGAWNFGTSGSYIFTDSFGSANANIGYQFGSCYQSAAHSYSSSGQTIAPQFKGAVNLNQPTVTLPGNSFNQEEAVLDGKGDGTTTVSNATMNAALRKQGDTQYPTGGATTGVYLPYTVVTSGSPPVTTRTMNGGGILVQGDANSVTLTAGTSGGHKTQVVTVTQGTSTITTTTITYDLDGGTTTLAQKIGSGSTTTTTINGLPQDLANSPVTEGAMVYVNGTINSLTGPSSGAAIQDTSAVTVVAANDINITGNLTYKTEPVTTSGSTPDTLIPANNNGQVFGIFTAGGNINLNMASSGQNVEIDASIAAIKQGGSGGLVNTGQAINQLTIVGGRIQNTIQNINTTTRNVWFDRRFAQGGFAPPWFPSTTVTVTGTPQYSPPTVSASRTSWVNVTAE